MGCDRDEQSAAAGPSRSSLPVWLVKGIGSPEAKRRTDTHLDRLRAPAWFPWPPTALREEEEALSLWWIYSKALDKGAFSPQINHIPFLESPVALSCVRELVGHLSLRHPVGVLLHYPFQAHCVSPLGQLFGLSEMCVKKRGLRSHQLIWKINTATLDFIFCAITFALKLNLDVKTKTGTTQVSNFHVNSWP